MARIRNAPRSQQKCGPQRRVGGPTRELAAHRGFEPRLTVPETVVLPLDEWATLASRIPQLERVLRRATPLTANLQSGNLRHLCLSNRVRAKRLRGQSTRQEEQPTRNARLVPASCERARRLLDSGGERGERNCEADHSSKIFVRGNTGPLTQRIDGSRTRALELLRSLS